MDTQFPDFAFELQTDDNQKSPLNGGMEIILPYHIREQFRPKLLEFFEQTNKHTGSYVRAELLAKEWFLDNMGIPFEAWEYRK